MVKLLSFLALLAATVFAAVSAHAQSVRWEPGSGTLAINQLSELNLVFDQCEPEGAVTLPAVSGLVFGQPNRSENNAFTVINGKASRSRTVTLTYRVRPTDRTPVSIPSFQVDTDKGRQLVASARFEIGDATVGRTSLSLDSIVQSRFTLPPGQVWAGEVFPVTYSLNSARRYFYQLGSDLEWNPAPLSVEPWGKPELLETTVNNEDRVAIIYKTRAYAKAPGSVALNPATQLVNLSTGSSSGFTVFARPSLEQFAITSQPATLAVRPLPAPAPAGFTGAVGKFTLDSRVVPAAAAVGEPITWTLSLDGTGNWPDIAGLPSRSVSKDFRIVQPQAKRANKNDTLFDASITEDIVLIPTKPGAYTLGPVSITVFNPSTGAYETLATQPVTIQVSGGTTSASSAPTSANVDSSDLQLKLPPSTDTAATPAALPCDPLPPAGTSLAPLSTRALVIGLLTALLCPLSVWFVLARRRASATDPARPLREAHARLVATLRQLAEIQNPESVPSAPSHQVSGLSSQASALCPQVSPLLQSWQRDTAILWQIPQAVPTPASFTASDSAIRHSSLDIRHSGGDSAAGAAWSALWSEADRTLYGAAPLLADWTARATQALATRRPRAFSTFQLFLPRNLLPLLLILASVLCLPSSADAAEGRDAYAKADFPAAEKAWRDTLATAPTDWTAHHNLALALIQQNRPGEAAAHALAAFVQQPQDDTVRRTLAYTYNSAGVSPPSVSQRTTLNARLAALASPTRWQALAIASAWLAALAAALTIQAAYRRSDSGLKLKLSPSTASASVLALLALTLALAAAVSLRTYGPLADARAVVVSLPTTLRSIPTDLDTPQKTTPLGAGVIAVTDKTFLGWSRLAFTDGQTGWARTETLVPLWHK